MSDRGATALVVGALLAAGALAWWAELRPAMRVDASVLHAIPYRVGAFEGKDLPVGAVVENMLSADYHLQRAYQHPFGDVIWLYIGYYGTARGGTPEHPVRACYAAHGWDVVRSEVLTLDGGGDARANEYLLSLDDNERAVLFWYRSFRSRHLLSIPRLRIDHVLGQLAEGRGDGALIRLSTPILDGDLLAARERLLHFASLLEPELDRVWPNEWREEP